MKKEIRIFHYPSQNITFFFLKYSQKYFWVHDNLKFWKMPRFIHTFNIDLCIVLQLIRYFCTTIEDDLTFLSYSMWNLETPTRRINTTRSAERIKSPVASLPPSIITERNSSSTSPPSSSHSQSPQDSPSIFVRPARVSRVWNFIAIIV